MTGCRTAPFPAANLSAPGWVVREGQAAWCPRRGQPEIAGEILLARNADGRLLVQLSKTPFLLLAAQASPERWRIEIPPRGKIYGARGTPPRGLIWFQLPAIVLDHAPAPQGWKLEWSDSRRFRLVRESTGESIEGVLQP